MNESDFNKNIIDLVGEKEAIKIINWFNEVEKTLSKSYDDEKEFFKDIENINRKL